MIFSRSILKELATGAVVAAGVAAVFWSGSAWAGGLETDAPTAPGFSSASAVSKQLPAVFSSFEADFPAGVKLPDLSERLQKLGNSGSSGPAMFEDNFAESQIVTVWRCSWERAYVDAASSGDAKARSAAGSQLSRYYDLAAVKRTVDDPEHAWASEVLTPALRGDSAAMEEDLVTSCGAPFTKSLVSN